MRHGSLKFLFQIALHLYRPRLSLSHTLSLADTRPSTHTSPRSSLSRTHTAIGAMALFQSVIVHSRARITIRIGSTLAALSPEAGPSRTRSSHTCSLADTRPSTRTSPRSSRGATIYGAPFLLQGCLAHKKQRPPRTLQWDNAQGPTVVLRGGLFLMSEVPLYFICAHLRGASRGTRLS